MGAPSTRPADSSFLGSDVDEEFVDDTSRVRPAAMIPETFTRPPVVRDDLQTNTSVVQDGVMEQCLPYLSGDHDEFELNDYGVPGLDRKKHARFLRNNIGKLPAPFIAADASRPWFLFWCLNGLYMLGEDVSSYSDNLVETARTMQNASGGFGGGNGQLSHLATSYSVVLALAIVGTEDAYSVIDRRAMWRWLCSIKQADGGFRMSVGGEEDIRGAYCASVLISLLNLPLELTPESPAWTAEGSNLFTGLADYVRRCQTFEGGISDQPGTEAHGAYAFCALGCLAILDSPDRIIPKYLNVPRLLSWLTSRQYAPEGGFSGRTNKLVDGCYSHWVGGCWPLVESIFSNVGPAAATDRKRGVVSHSGSLFSREGLIRYILCCCQDQTKRGGLRDKPGKPSDAYHTCYVLSGLSSAEHKWELTRNSMVDESDVDNVLPSWEVSPYLDEVQIFEEQDRIRPIHPVYTIPEKAVTDIKQYFAAKQGF